MEDGLRAWRAAVLLGAAAGAACVRAASAQEVKPPEPQAAPAPANDASAPNGEIVVTAQKSQQRLKDVPSSVAVLSGDTLRAQSADRLEDYVARVPGLVLDARGSGQQQITIRGLSTGTQGGPTVAVYIDDAPVGASNQDGAGGLVTPEIDSIDLQRIEVLRGPQGTLYGAANIGGLLKYVTVAPDTHDVTGAISLDGDTIAHGELGYALRGRINVPVSTDKAALLISGYYRRDPGFVDDAGLHETNLDTNKRLGGRIALKLTPTPSLSITAAAIAQNSKADGFTQVDLDPVTLVPLYGQYQQRRAKGSEYYENKVRLYYLTVENNFDWARLSSTTSYNTVSNQSSSDFTAALGPVLDLGIPNLGYSDATNIKQNKFTQEVRLTGEYRNSVKWLAGVFYTRENSGTLVTVPTFDATTGVPVVVPSILISDVETHYREIAGFGQLDFRFGSWFNLTVGGRYAHNTERNITTSSGFLVGPATVTPLSSSDNVATFTVSPQFKLSDHLTAYVRVASGYRPGGANGAFAPDITYGPDRVMNYEAGLKGSFPASRLSFEIARFYVDWTNIQLPLLTDQGLSFISNVGKASSRGFEANMAYTPVRGLSFSATAAYTDAHLNRDIAALSGDIPPSSYGIKGDRLPYSPRWKASSNLDYTTEVGGGWSGFVGGGIFYTSDERAEFQGDAVTPRIRLPGFVTADARLGLTRDKLSVSLIGKNIFDKIAYNGVRSLASPTGPAAFSLIQARTVLLSLKFDY